MVKKGSPERALKLKRAEEWEIYLEFLKVLFNLADRISVLHIPILDQPEFMNSLEDRVTESMKRMLGAAFSANSDPMELTLTIGNAVAESRQVYERYKFMATEESTHKSEMLMQFGERVARAFGDSKNAQVSASAVLCAAAVIPAMQALFEGKAPDQPTESLSTMIAHHEQQPVGTGSPAPSGSAKATGAEIKLVSVMAAVTGEQVETRWGLHPRFRRDLTSAELQELTRVMNRLTKIVGERYAAVAFSEQWASWHAAGHA
ncbi:hypothetical protein YTPLAS18_12440 [Nitrospira sp.]|nr:hypothetical protein YTPLAS18_12440 [Nitrospira sp.]